MSPRSPHRSRRSGRRAALGAWVGVLLVGAAAPATAQDPEDASRPAAAAQAAPAPAEACSGAEHRAFDFWIGRWEVTTADGKLTGENRIERTAGGCVLHESWRGEGGMTGSSLNAYDRADGRWHQVWMDSNGLRLDLAGGVADGRMVMTGERPAADGGRVLHRISWEPRPDGGLRQLWEISSDDGATWSVAFDGLYTRKH